MDVEQIKKVRVGGADVRQNFRAFQVYYHKNRIIVYAGA